MSEISIKIAIAEPSTIIRSGLASIMKRIQGYQIQTIEIPSTNMLTSSIRMYKPDMLIVNPVYCSPADIAKLKEETNAVNMKVVVIVTGFYDDFLKSQFDEFIGLYDTTEQLQQKLKKMFCEPEAEEKPDEVDTLSQREKEIVTCVVKGLTNKEIANELFLSTHTVITHRRNIARKLGIHSAAGLTVYAIVNKLVEIKDLNANSENN